MTQRFTCSCKLNYGGQTTINTQIGYVQSYTTEFRTSLKFRMWCITIISEGCMTKNLMGTSVQE